MLINLYNALIFMSLLASLLYLILKTFSTLTNKYFSAAWHYYSYLFISSFFIIPYYTLLSKVHEWVALKADGLFLFSPRTLNLPSEMLSVTESVVTTEKVLTSPEEINKLHLFFEFIPYVLMSGTLLFTLIIIFQNYRLNRRIYSVCHLMTDKEMLKVLSECKQELIIEKKIPVYISDYAHTPFISGIFRPRIVLPKIEFSMEELRYVFLHELTHWRNKDALLKHFVLVINVVHWFNPLAYMMRSDIDRFCESFCDKSVTKSMNKEERRRYCELILSVLWHVADQNVNLSSAFSNKRKIERRVSLIMEAKKNKKWTRLLAVIMTLALSLGGTVSAYAFINSDVPRVSLPESNVGKINVAGSNNDVPGDPEDPDITPYNAIYINDDEYSGTSYDKFFSTNSANDNRLNIDVTNNSSFRVTMKITNTDTNEFNTYTIAAGGQKTDTWTNADGIRNSYRVQVNNSDGERMDIVVSARQF